jgi:hypothetical protein
VLSAAAVALLALVIGMLKLLPHRDAARLPAGANRTAAKTRG